MMMNGVVGFVPMVNDSCNKFGEKTKNNVKHTAAAAGVAGLAGTGAYLALKAPKAPKVDVIFKDLANEAPKMGEAVKDGAAKVAENVKKVTKEVIDDIKNSKDNMPKNAAEFKEKAQEALNTANKASKGIWGSIKKAANKVTKFASTITGKVSKELKNIPTNQKIAGGVALAGLAAIGLIMNHNSYNNGKIDQKYDDKQKLYDNYMNLG